MDSQLQYYDIFYDVALACTLLSNGKSPAYLGHAAAVVDFHCQAYGLTVLADEWQKSILTTMQDIAVLGEREADYSRRRTDDDDTQANLLLDIKCDVLAELGGKYRQDTLSVNHSWFDYAHLHRYNPYVRYAQIRDAASAGWRVAARMQGVMLALGIGCERNVAAAIRKFTQCAYWSDLPSVQFLSFLYAAEGNSDSAALFGQLSTLLQTYLKDGLTDIPAEVRSAYRSDAVDMYRLVASIYRDICLAYHLQDIDFSFVEVMMQDLSWDEKMDCINGYENMTWRGVSNPTHTGGNNIGFSRNGRK